MTYTNLFNDCSVKCGTGTQYTTNICNLVTDGTGLWGHSGCPNSKERTYRECKMPDCDKGIIKIEYRIIIFQHINIYLHINI